MLNILLGVHQNVKWDSGDDHESGIGSSLKTKEKSIISDVSGSVICNTVVM